MAVIFRYYHDTYYITLNKKNQYAYKKMIKSIIVVLSINQKNNNVQYNQS